MKIEDNHAHAITYYERTSFKHFFALFISVVTTKFKKYLSLTAHLPLEIQHPTVYSNLAIGKIYIHFGELLKRLFSIKLYWENAPLLEFGTWKLKYGQTDFDLLPDKGDLCFDTGHIILGSHTIAEAKKRIIVFEKKYSKRIKHLHIHENNLISDQHIKPKKVITPQLLARLIQGRTYIFEK